MADVKYILVQPDKVIKSDKTWGVVLPTGKINQTVISGQTPSVIKTDTGIVRILNEKGSVVEDFFISAGLATIVDDECIVSSENIISRHDASLEMAQSFDDDFHRLIAENLKSYK